jgi:hypothetical protein
MLEKIFWFGVGFLVARYIILKDPNYKQTEADTIDSIRNSVHDLVMKYAAPDTDESAVSSDVITTVK